MGNKRSSKESKDKGRQLGKVDTLLNEKLKNVEWGKFRVGQIFEIENTLSFNTNKLISGEQFDYVTRTSQNQGVLQKTGFVNCQNINQACNWSLGLLQMDFFYRPNPWYAGQFVRKIIPKIDIDCRTVPFFTSTLNTLKPLLLSVLVRNVDKTFLNAELTLPATKDGDIDIDFMERFIAELEASRIKELDKYLKDNGLSNYHLTEKEKQALDDFENLNWKTFNLESLFGKSTRGKRLKSADRIDGNLPFITAGETDEGVSAFIGNKVEVFSENTTTIDMFGSAKYRNFKYGGDDHIAVVHIPLSNKKLTF